MFDPQIFDSLQQKIDEDVAVREKLKEIVQTLEKQDRATQAILSRAHSTKAADLLPVLDSARTSIQAQAETVAKLSQEASRYPYYKYNGMWTRQMQDTVATILLESYLRTTHYPSSSSSNHDSPTPAIEAGLLPPAALAAQLNIPLNTSSSTPTNNTATSTNVSSDVFHLTTEEYLHGVLSLTEELTRLARNAVTLGDYAGAVAIAAFVKSLHAGFQVLNLRNDALRKRADAVKYRVKEVEDVVYDLSLRGLVPGR